jgi:hypothetical protein
VLDNNQEGILETCKYGSNAAINGGDEDSATRKCFKASRRSSLTLLFSDGMIYLLFSGVLGSCTGNNLLSKPEIQMKPDKTTHGQTNLHTQA